MFLDRFPVLLICSTSSITTKRGLVFMFIYTSHLDISKSVEKNAGRSECYVLRNSHSQCKLKKLLHSLSWLVISCLSTLSDQRKLCLIGITLTSQSTSRSNHLACLGLLKHWPKMQYHNQNNIQWLSKFKIYPAY